MKIPFYRPQIAEEEIAAVTDVLRSGWLTTGPKTKEFEAAFASFSKAKHAVALNSATAALHLALEAIGLHRGETVVVPTMTFAATAEVVRYFDAKPLLVDCRESDLNIDIVDARRRIEGALARGERLRAIIPVHYGGLIADMPNIHQLAREFDLRVIEDAAHCCPAYYRVDRDQPWLSVGAGSDISCFSFYANKCITTGEGGMACTNDDDIADRMRVMGLHGISKDAWKRFTDEGSWYYEIVAPGFKYNLTDIASSLGLQQLKKADGFRIERERVARRYSSLLARESAVVTMPEPIDRIHSWHLYVIRLKLDEISIDRAKVISLLKAAGVGTSVHWMPLHLHPYYKNTYGHRAGDFPVSTRLFEEIISLPIYPTMSDEEVNYVCGALTGILDKHRT